MQIPLTIPRNGGWMYFQDPEIAWLACSNGLTNCASLNSLYWRRSHPFLLLMHVIPQVFICNTKEGRDHPSLDSELPYAWRAMLIITTLLVGEGIVGPTSVGTSALVMGNKNFFKKKKKIPKCSSRHRPGPSRKFCFLFGSPVRLLRQGCSWESKRIGPTLYEKRRSLYVIGRIL